MSDRYLLILVLYTLASFAATLAMAEGGVRLGRKQVLRLIARLKPTDGVLAHLVLRFLPAVLALVLTSISAVPGYFRGEPMGTHELPGPWLIALALLGLYSVVVPLSRVAWLSLRTAAKMRTWGQSAVGSDTFSNLQVVELSIGKPIVVAAGLVHKKIFLSTFVRSLLSARELRAVLRHEAAHCSQNHNLTKLLCALAPRLMPLASMDESLHETIEFAADDAACGVPGDALNLASAVVILARQAAVAPKMLFTAFVDPRHTAMIERRVERLVLPTERRTSEIFSRLAAGCVALIAVTAAVGALPAAQHAFRETLELLVR